MILLGVLTWLGLVGVGLTHGVGHGLREETVALPTQNNWSAIAGALTSGLGPRSAP